MLALLPILKSVGPKILAFIILLAIVFFSITWIREDTRTDFLKDQKIEQIEKEVDIRKRVDAVLEENRKTNPDRDGAIALERLRKQYGTD